MKSSVLKENDNNNSISSQKDLPYLDSRSRSACGVAFVPDNIILVDRDHILFEFLLIRRMIMAFYSRMSAFDHLFITIMLRTGVKSYFSDKYGQQNEKPVFKISHTNCFFCSELGYNTTKFRMVKLIIFLKQIKSIFFMVQKQAVYPGKYFIPKPYFFKMIMIFVNLFQKFAKKSD
jgi:hypothetical protein